MKDEVISLPHYLELLQSHGQYWFLRKDAITLLKLTDNAFKLAAYRLMKKGKLSRVRGDFYTLIPAEYYATGSLPAIWFIDALMKHLGQQYYVALLTAAALQGSAHQQPIAFQVITDKRTRSITVGQVRIEFFYKKEIREHFYENMKTSTGTMHVSTPEMTAFDLVRYMDTVGQVNHVATVLCELSERINPDTLAKLVENRSVELTAAQRLGYLLDHLDLPIDLAPLERSLKNKNLTLRLLVTGSTAEVIENNHRWHILVNENVEPDEL